MRSSRPLALLAAALAILAGSAAAQAQVPARGFAVERLYPAAPGAGWLVMDDLQLEGGLGAAVAVLGGYAHAPLRLTSASGAQHLDVVSGQAFAGVGLAVHYDRYRLSVQLDSPLAITGSSGTLDGYAFRAPSVDIGRYPDKITDFRLGIDARLLGAAHGSWRLGASTQLIVPSGDRDLYLTDDTARGMARLLFAGDAGIFCYAAHLGAHLRPLNDAPVPGSPRGSEFLFGVAGGARLAQGEKTALVIGPEVFGQTAFSSFFASSATGLEAMLTARFEHEQDSGALLRVKAGMGAGLHPQFGAPEWRGVLALELSGRTSPPPTAATAQPDFAR